MKATSIPPRKGRAGLSFLLGVLAGATVPTLMLTVFLAASALSAPSPVAPDALPTRTAATPEDGVLLSVPAISQYPDYPTGCEVVTATMALQYAGVSVDTATLIDCHLPTSTAWYTWKGVEYGPDPNAAFLGDPRSQNSYGCFAPVIWRMLESYLGDSSRITDATGATLEQLCREYLDRGEPVMLWATMEMTPLRPGASWTLPDGTLFTWPGGEHCLLLVGYDAQRYYFNDPRKGACVAYTKEAVRLRYDELGRQALVIHP